MPKTPEYSRGLQLNQNSLPPAPTVEKQTRAGPIKVPARPGAFLRRKRAGTKGRGTRQGDGQLVRSFGPHESKITKAFICRFCSFRAHASKVTRRNETRFLVTYVRHAPAAYTYSGVRERFTGSALLSRWRRFALDILFPRSRFSPFLFASRAPLSPRAPLSRRRNFSSRSPRMNGRARSYPP